MCVVTLKELIKNMTSAMKNECTSVAVLVEVMLISSNIQPIAKTPINPAKYPLCCSANHLNPSIISSPNTFLFIKLLVKNKKFLKSYLGRIYKS